MTAAEAEALVRRFLAGLEARDLDAARALTASGFVMTFPGGVEMRELDELVAWAKPRYRRLGKRVDGVDLIGGGRDWVAICRGALGGEWPDGRPFEGVRFIDRFEIRGGRIARQEVWNDLAEVRSGR